jgi:hypothetical protein
MLIHDILHARYHSNVLATRVYHPKEYILYLDQIILGGAMMRTMRKYGIQLQSRYVKTLGTDEEGDEILANTELLNGVFYVRIRSDIQESVTKVGSTTCKRKCIQHVIAHEMAHVLVGMIRIEHALDDVLWSILIKNTEHDTLFLYIINLLFRITDESVL